MLKKILVIIVLIANVFYGQSIKKEKSFTFGLVLESSLLFVTEDIFSYNNVSLKSNSTTDTYPISIFINSKFFIKDNLAIEIKPGWVFGDDKFTALELGFYLQHYFLGKSFLGKVGINFHKNIPSAHGAFESTNEMLYSFGLIVGYRINKNFSFTFGYYKPLRKYEYYHKHYGFISGINYRLKGIVNNILRVGLEYSF